MTDKVQKIREEVVRLRNLHQMKYQQIDINDNMCLVECGKRNLCNELLSFIDSLQEEPVSDDLEKAAEEWDESLYRSDAFKAGAKWQNDRMMENTIDAQCFGFQGDALFSFRLPPDSYLVGSKVKVIVIKED